MYAGLNCMPMGGFNPWMMGNGMGMGMNNPFSQSSSDDIFSNMNMNMPFLGGGISPFGGFGMGSIYGMDPRSAQQYYSQMNLDQRRFMTDYRVQDSRQNTLAKYQMTAAEDAISSEVGTLQRVIGKNNQDYVNTHIGKLKSLAKEQLLECGQTDINEKQINAYANKLYYERTGRSLESDLEEKGDGEFVHGLKKGLDPAGFFTNERSAAENISDITGEEISNKDKASSVIGRVVSMAAVGVAAFVGLVLLGKGAKGLFKKSPQALINKLKALETSAPEKADEIRETITTLEQKIKGKATQHAESQADKLLSQARRY